MIYFYVNLYVNYLYINIFMITFAFILKQQVQYA